MTLHQETLLSMLKDIDSLCKERGIRYQLFAGTLLGAARHQGFIPWDDDADVAMLRADYDRFLELAPKYLDTTKYYVQREFTEHWPMQFSKLRLNGTTCIEKYHAKDSKTHEGVYVDIFPCDNLSDSSIAGCLQFAASKVVIAKSLYARGYETDNVAKKAFMQLCRPLPLTPFRKSCMRGSDNRSRKVHVFLGAAHAYSKSVFPREWLEETVELPFEGEKFPVSAHYDELLTTLYGDWKKIPEPEERDCKRHVAILDLNRPYTDYLNEQRNMVVDSYTRSIR